MNSLQEASQLDDHARWKCAVAAGGMFILLCAIPITERIVLMPFIALQNSVTNCDQGPSDEQRRQQRLSDLIADKRRVASDLLGGRRVTYFEASNWKPPYISSDPNAPPLSREIANWQHALSGTAENPMQSGEPEPKKGNQAPSRFDRFLTPEDLAIREANGRGQQE